MSPLSGANVTQLDGIALAVSEAVTNAVVHAYDDHAGPIRVHTTANAQRILITR